LIPTQKALECLGMLEIEHQRARNREIELESDCPFVEIREKA
jgi:hypothetical protein